MCWRRATTSSGARARTDRSLRAPPIPSATRATSCSPRRPSSSAICGFPLGAHAARPRCARSRASFGLPVAEKADSQDICFVPTGRYTGVIERLKPGALKPGDIVHVDGRRLGRHDGIINYTDRPAPRPENPWPGAALRRPPRCRAQRGRRGTARLPCARHALLLRNTNWLGDEPFAEAAAGGLRLFVRVRSSQAPQPATLFAEADGACHGRARGRRGRGRGGAGLRVLFRAARPDARLLGGGFIARTIAHAGTGTLEANARAS